jgi:hypothetical protein
MVDKFSRIPKGLVLAAEPSARGAASSESTSGGGGSDTSHGGDGGDGALHLGVGSTHLASDDIRFSSGTLELET